MWKECKKLVWSGKGVKKMWEMGKECKILVGNRK